MEEFTTNQFNQAMRARTQALQERRRFEALALQDARNGQPGLAQAMLREAERSARQAEHFSRMVRERFQALQSAGVA